VHMEIISAAVMLFLIMDPLGNLPIFLSILKHIDKKRRRTVMIRELLIALFVMLLFLFLGEQILGFLNLKQEAVSIAGGIILFLIAIKMIFPSEGSLTGLAVGEEPFIVPMAIPLLAGPSILAALLLLAHQNPDKMLEWSISLIIAWGVSAFILMFYEAFNRILGEKGLAAVERLMGMLLVMISVQMLLDGIADYLTTVG
jgi:MarC family membrane protein